MQKTLILLTFSAALHAAPITWTTTGAVSPIADGYFFNLLNAPGTENDRIATFTASAPLASLELYADNLPFAVGSGLMFYLDGVLVLDTGLGNLVQQTLTLTALTPFTEVRLETHELQGWLERGTLTGFVAVPAESAVPEPGSWLLLAAGLASIVGWRRK